MCFSKSFSRTGLVALLIGLVTACGGGREAPPAPSLPVLNDAPIQGDSNVLRILVDCGPTDALGKCIGYNVNRLYTSVTVCASNSTPRRCQTIDHVLVDTGSWGLRLLAPVLASELELTRATGDSGWPLLNCVQFVDNTYAWGTVATADILLGDKRANSVPIQIIGDPISDPTTSKCGISIDDKEITSYSAITNIVGLGAKGILGVGLRQQDCGIDCVVDSSNGSYFACTDPACSAAGGSTVALARQVSNPVSLFAGDNNGVVIDFSDWNGLASRSLLGSLYFGINTTRPNNQLANAAVLTTNSSGYVTTVYGGQTFPRSFLDTGSNGLFFDSAITGCDGAVSGSYFYCPESPLTLFATIRGANPLPVVRVTFAIDKATTLFDGGVNAVLPTLSGNIVSTGMFDWGLPFFYGRRVFFGIEGQFIEGQPSVPLYAF